MSERVRAFFALPLEGEPLGALGRARDALRRRAERSRLTARFLGDEALHLTLCFLGYVPRDAVLSFAGVLEAVRRDPLASQFRALGAFPSPARARVVVAELDDEAGRLGALARSIAEACVPLGVPLETRPFRPHVTLARLKRPGDVRDWLAHAEIAPVALRFHEIRLYESLLGPHGSRYEVLARVDFGAA